MNAMSFPWTGERVFWSLPTAKDEIADRPSPHFNADRSKGPFSMSSRLRAAQAASVLAFTAVVLATAPLALAQSKPNEKQRAAVLQAVLDCRAQKDPDQRLKCYDEASARLDQAEASGQVVVVDREQARQVRREIFGLQLPSLEVFGRAGRGLAGLAGGGDEEGVDRISGVLKHATPGANGRWTFELESGAVWRSIEAVDFAIEPRPGAKVTIRKASLGSFMMKIDTRPAFKAHRDR